MLRFERPFWEQGFCRVAGVDEAGRGPLAGPVFAAAVIFDPGFVQEEEQGLLRGLTDSKQLSESVRESFFRILTESPRVERGVGIADVEEIDRLNIYHATCLAMVRAVENLSLTPDHVLVDGRAVKGFPCASTAIIGGDSKSLSVAAASVIAKVTRDARMRELDRTYSQYGFAQHKGYGTRAHMRALFEFGPSPVHRRSFRPVREAERIRTRGVSADE